ncbi:MAG: Mur ligase family protein [Myxococcota bacterium]
MRFEHARRLTGPSPLMPGPGAAVEHVFEAGDDAGALAARWDELLDRALAAAGIAEVRRFRRDYPGGASLGIDGPIDRLYAEVDLLEWISEVMSGQATLTEDQAIARFREAAAIESNPCLLALQAAARAHGVAFLWDENEASLGLGPTARTWPVRELPAPDAIAALDFAAFGRIPVALVTGTNGKTTTTRMATRILKHAGHVVGTTSTDAITVDEVVVESGDWTGPGAARKVLRRNDVTAAVLETARGGILRRGLALDQVDAAIVTNVAEDHFGDWGVYSLDAMADAKALVWQAVRPGGTRIVPADDPVLLAHARPTPDAWTLVAMNADAPAIAAFRAAGGKAWFVRDGAIVRAEGPRQTAVVPVADVPVTFGGHALHNLQNAIAAAALTHALGASDAAIRSGLASFGLKPSDNPGRAQLHEVDGVRVLLDFSHNPHGVRAMRATLGWLVEQVPGSRLSIALGQAGDRSDGDLAALAHEIAACRPDLVFLRPLPGYERGRALGETAAILHRDMLAEGLPPDAVRDALDEVDSLEQALAWARPGDLVVHFVHIEREAVAERLARAARKP